MFIENIQQQKAAKNFTRTLLFRLDLTEVKVTVARLYICTGGLDSLLKTMYFVVFHFIKWLASYDFYLFFFLVNVLEFYGETFVFNKMCQ